MFKPYGKICILRRVLLVCFLAALFIGMFSSISTIHHQFRGNTSTMPKMHNSSDVVVHFINVGWGDAIFIDTSDKDVLIDGGRQNAGQIVLNYLIKLNVTCINLMIATHPHEDHINGLVTVLKSTIEVNQVLINNQSYPSSFFALAQNHNLTVAYRGQIFILTETANLTVLNPVQPLQVSPSCFSQHNNCIVVKLQVGSKSFLFAGDACAHAEQSMLNEDLDLNSDVLKVGVHGLAENTFELATTQDFLDRVDPSYAVISCNYTNGGGIRAPDPQVVKRLLASDVATYSTHILGTIVAFTNGTSIAFSENTRFSFTVELTGHTKAVYSLAWSPSGDLLASGSKDGTVRLWNTTTWETSLTINAHVDGVWSVAWSPDGLNLATGGVENKIRLWASRTGEALATLNVSTSTYPVVYSVSWSPDNHNLAAGLNSGTVLVFDVDTGQVIHKLTGHLQPIIATVWSPDGAYLASGSIDRTIRIWDVETWSLIFILRANTTVRNDINGLAWSPKGTALAAAGQDSNVRLWDPQLGSEIRVLRGHLGWTRGVIWSPDGLTVATTGEDCFVRLWNLDNSADMTALPGHLSPVWSVAWSPDGRLLASGSGEYEVSGGDDRVLIWNVSAPLASFVWTPTTPRVGIPIVFNASSSSARGGSITSYEWDFGDGNMANISECAVYHTFAAVGNYTITLNVEDSEGLWSTRKKAISILLRGDINGDNKVDIKDLVMLTKALGSFPSHPRWDSDADLNRDNKVDIKDLVLVIKHFGEHYP